MAAHLDPAAVLLAGTGMVAAPIVMPQVARELFGVDPSSAEFRGALHRADPADGRHLAGEGPDGSGDTPGPPATLWAGR